MRTIAIIQARTGSRRLPGKVLMPLGGKPEIHWVVSRTAISSEIDKVVLATTTASEDDKLAEWANENGILCFRGSEQNVLQRYYYAALFARAKEGDIIVRITGDCPLIDPDICSNVIRLLKSTGADYACNTNPPTYPDGLDCEAMQFNALKASYENAVLKYQQEHVTQYILNNPQLFTLENYSSAEDFSLHRWTLDEPEDYTLLSRIFEALDGRIAGMHDVLKFLEQNEDVDCINASIERNEGLKKSMQEEDIL